MAANDMFTDIDTVAPTVGNDKIPFLEEGLYPKLQVVKCETGESFGGDEYCRIVVKVLESNGPKAAPVGSERVRLIMKDKFKYYIKDLLFFASALFGVAPNQVSSKVTAEIFAADNPAKGHLISAEVVPNEKAPTFPKVRWRPVDNKA